jgi:hypothetical protein
MWELWQINSKTEGNWTDQRETHSSQKKKSKSKRISDQLQERIKKNEMQG